MTEMNERRYDIDWLRVLVMLAVFFFHCARFFAGGTWHLNNEDQSLAALIFIGWLDMWFMPLFFLLSGFGAWYALKSGNSGQFVLARSKRILVPLYTVGLFVLLPPQFYFEIFSNGGYGGTFPEALPLYVKGLGHFSFSWPGSLLPVPFSGHLWFLQYLFLISLATLPVLNYLRSEKGVRVIRRLSGWCSCWGGVFLFLIPVALIRIGLRWFCNNEHSWADFLEFAVFFIIGYLLPSDPIFTKSIRKHAHICLGIGTAAFGAEAFFVLGLGYNPGGEPFSVVFILFEAVMSIGRLSWIVFVLGMGSIHLNFNTTFLAYCNEAVLPFYILHQTIILCVGWFVIPWNMGIFQKYLAISCVSFVLIMGVYEGLVRRNHVMRFLFGMQAHKEP